MKLAIQYVNDSKGNLQSVQLPVADWQKIVAKIKEYEQVMKIRSDLQEAYQQVAMMRKSKGKKQTLTDFLNEL